MDPSITEGLSAAALIGFAIACVRFAIGQADKRATVAEATTMKAEAREETCAKTLLATTGTTAALTEEIRKSGGENVRKLEENARKLEESTRRMEDGARRLAALEAKVDRVLVEVTE